MDTDRSPRAPAALHPAVAPVAVVAGLVAMFAAGAVAGPLGLRAVLIVAEVALAWPALLAAFWPEPRRALALRPVSSRTVLIAIGSGMALWAASLGLLELQYALWPPPPGYLQEFQRLHETLRPRGAADALFSVTAIAAAPAVCEELLFRGLVLPALVPALGNALAVAATSLLFGIIHLDVTGGAATLYRVPFAVLVGAGFALLRLRGGSLVPAMLAHGVLNTITFATALQSPLPQQMPPAEPALGLALLLGGGAAQAGLLRLMRPGGLS
jgi:membrane protease YdiL (CAAX protease family)